jgi:hypothetical protein
MKKTLQLAVILLAFLPAISFAQATEGAHTAQAAKNVWPEMTAFHTLMSGSFHPAEEGNFVPLKENAERLFAAARTWQKSAIPEDKFKPKETKEALKKLVLDCNAVNKAVIAKHNDEELRRLITKAHDTFHTIVGECRQAE